WMKQGEVSYFFLPGVPYEMKNLITSSVLPKIMETYDRPYIVHKTLLTYGMGESAVAERIEEWENSLPPHSKLAYLATPGRVRLRLSSKGTDREALKASVEAEAKKLYAIIGDIIYGEEENGTIESQIGKFLTQKKMTLATAESFTGGKIAEQITSVPGASNYFKGSVVSYATDTKIKVLGIPEEMIQKHSGVSEEVAMAMAENVRNLLGTDF